MDDIKMPDMTYNYIRLDERNHVEKPLLDQLDGLGWEVIAGHKYAIY